MLSPLSPKSEDATRTSCDLCGDQFVGKVYSKRGRYDILQCPRCRLIWCNPLVYSWQQQEDLASDPYYAFDVYAATANEFKKRFSMQLQWFMQIAGLSDSETIASFHMLEVGCGPGYFLDVCDDSGLSAEGCDIHGAVTEYANRPRNRVRVGTLDDSYADGSFDAIFAFNVIEHLLYPKQFLITARRVLRPGGWLVLEMPIQEGLFHYMGRIADRLLGPEIGDLGVDPGAHIHKFSKKTFELICKDLHFQKAYERQLGSPYGEISGKLSLNRGKGLDIARRLHRLALPVVWQLAELTDKGNRYFIILRK